MAADGVMGVAGDEATAVADAEVGAAADDEVAEAAGTVAAEEGALGTLLMLHLLPPSRMLRRVPRLIGWERPLGARLRTLRLPHPATSLSHRTLERIGVGRLPFSSTPDILPKANGHRRLAQLIRSTNWE